MRLDLAPAAKGRRSSFRVALRVARRDIGRHKGRSLLIVLLIMLPVAGMTGAATLFQSAQRTPAEIVEYELGGTQARFSVLPAPNAGSVQDPLNDAMVAYSTGEYDPGFVPADPQDLLPPGYEVLPLRQLNLTTGVGTALVSLQGRIVDTLHPAFAGKFTLLRGRAPRSAAEALVSPGLLERFSIQLGEEITTSAGTFVPVGTIRDADASDRNSVIFLKQGQVADEALNQGSQSPHSLSYYLVGSEPVTWRQIREANRQGVSVLSRSVVLNPPSLAERSPDGVPPPQPPSDSLAVYAMFGLIAALALLEVGLLAGAAFAVGAKSQVRELALLAASGADSPTVRSVVTSGGLWLGSIAVVWGAALGLCSAAAVVHWVRSVGSARFPGIHADVPLTLVAMVLGLACCLLAAMAPANHVARQAALGALKSGRAPAGNGKRTTVAGAALLLLAGALLAAGWVLGESGADPDRKAGQLPLVTSLLIAGAVLAVVALVLLAGFLVTLLTARTGTLPLSLRMAARDAARNRGRTVPAVAAVLAAATLASAALVLSASQQAVMRENHSWNALENQVFLPLSLEQPLLPDGSTQPAVQADPAELAAAVEAALSNVAWTQVVTAPAYIQNCAFGPGLDLSAPPRTATSNCLQYSLAKPAGNECPVTPQRRVVDPDDWRCRGSLGQSPGSRHAILVGGANEISAVLGREAGPEALAVLEAGGMVVTNPVFVREGRAVLEGQDVRTQTQDAADPSRMHETVTSSMLPAVVVEPAEALPYYGVISPETAQRLDLRPEAAELLVQLSRFPSAAEVDTASGAIAAVYGRPDVGFWAEPGITQGDSWMTWSIVAISALITFSAAGITTGLSLADARADHVTLAGIGASPRLRKSLAGSQALLTAGLGTVLGSLAGTVPAALVARSTELRTAVEVPWIHLVALLVAVPLAGALLAWLFTRARLPASRRALGT
ncbi:putative ABC transport system permease protein [Arthrobacter sp. SLBN-100]|uniref:FtsX-like permease family protein n=1 Tax=Arthrobacter sp. SLBN-100 TaxID=2768450 RepID=UPI00114D91CB|nr:FtsX-like permease family protein [Arthrobacter sp. SLBN-100]TQJ69402.1 putative ABC transport system permease protein [Arthrobacter sp. SLBN-100]